MYCLAFQRLNNVLLTLKEKKPQHFGFKFWGVGNTKFNSSYTHIIISSYIFLLESIYILFKPQLTTLTLATFSASHTNEVQVYQLKVALKISP